jgi:hypothetical protein
LRDGDELLLGSVTLRFAVAADGAGTAVREYAFGDVHGPVQTGSGQQYTAGRDQYVAGRDQYHDNSVRVENDYDAWDELFRGRGVGRVLMAVGSLIALAGFGIVGYFIFVFGFGSNINDFGGPGELTDPFQKELLPGVPMVAAGFGLFVVGGVLAGIGGGMSKAARKREEELRQRQRWQQRGPDG